MDELAIDPKPKRKIKAPRRPGAVVLKRGVWEPVRFAWSKPKTSDLRTQFADVTEAIDEMQLESERIERALEFLRSEVSDQEARLATIKAGKAAAREQAVSLLARLAGDAAAQPELVLVLSLIHI